MQRVIANIMEYKTQELVRYEVPAVCLQGN